MSTLHTQPSTLEPGSFRDPDSRVFYAGDAVYRALSTEGLDDFRALQQAGLLEDPRIVATELRRRRPRARRARWSRRQRGCCGTSGSRSCPIPTSGRSRCSRTPRCSSSTCCSAALERDLVLKDSTPTTCSSAARGALFVDVGSFERLRPGEPWAGYRQFCMLYLYPLLLQALKGVRFQPWLRGSIEGITATEMRGLMSARDRFRRGLPTHVFLHARLERRYADRGGEVREDLRRAGFRKALIVANVRKLRALVQRLHWDPPAGVWTAYGDRNSYTDADIARKEAFVREAAAACSPQLVWDIGANNGRYSRLAAEHAGTVVAIDADQGPIELLYRELRDEGDERILPLTIDLADPSPGLGWRGLERRALGGRGRPDLVLALALVHHLAIAANVPVREVVDWLAGLGSALVVEFPTREDPMVQKLLAPKREGLHPDYELGHFERCLAEAFTIERTERLGSGTRVLFFARPKRA